jgi:hypothetical protein
VRVFVLSISLSFSVSPLYVEPSHHPIVISQVPQTSQTTHIPKFCVIISEDVSRKLRVCSFCTRGLRSVIGLDDDKVLANMSKDPEHTLECEFLVAGDQDDIDNFYSTKNGTLGNRDDMCVHVTHSIQKGKYHDADFSQWS